VNTVTIEQRVPHQPILNGDRSITLELLANTGAHLQLLNLPDDDCSRKGDQPASDLAPQRVIADWGNEDERGALNFITDRRVAAAP